MTLLAVTPASSQAVCPLYRYTPAHVETIAEQVLVRPASRVVQRRGAILRTITERVLVQPEHTAVRRETARFRTITETVLVRPANRTTRYLPAIRAEDVSRAGKGSPKGSPRPNRTARSVELRAAETIVDTTPATYATRTRRVLVRSAQTLTQTVPATFANRTRTVEVSPASAQVVAIPAAYRTVHRSLLYPALMRLTVSAANCAYGGPRVGWGPAPSSRQWIN